MDVSWLQELRRLKRKSIYPFRTRIRRRVTRLFATHFVTYQKLYVVDLNGHKYKRLVARDSHIASRIAENLRAFQSSAIFPELIWEHENELLLEYVEGAKIEVVDQHLVSLVAEFYSVIYATNPRSISMSTCAFSRTVHSDLQFLNNVGVLSNDAYHKLTKVVDDATPEYVWIGYDYTDPYLANFVIAPDGTLRAFDVESLRSEYLTGSGVVKALVNWMEPHRDYFAGIMKENSVPDFMSYMPFIEISYLSYWVKRSYLHGKKQLVRPWLFDRFIQGPYQSR